ncbi:TetR/AcrR family transcriptional regulator [Arthrobacter sunyaminii]|uniref:TetR/AcrR family transcriptional regulator n=1 Tax=Arthrobacter sunyaminii TaxID=2816859 RepID=UPI001A94705F|nr:TetR/AcrR family transcriptional regulator [Arthrobacter sunyaminii]MBO0897017.1 TetR/AcrR family transcriptional regulator [Arthrobacter sunyaminii]
MPEPEDPKPQRRSSHDEPRTARTREALEAGLWELLRDHELADISVAALCRRAGVHRTTFYGHHRNIFDFAASVYAGVVDRLGTVDVDQRGTGRTVEEINVLYIDSVRRILQHTREEERVYRALFHTETFLGVMAGGLAQRFLLSLHVWKAHGVVPAVNLEATAAYLGGAYAAWIEQWVVSGDNDVDGWLGSLVYLLPPWWPRSGYPGVRRSVPEPAVGSTTPGGPGPDQR